MKTAMAWGLIGVIVWLLVRPMKHTVPVFITSREAKTADRPAVWR